MYARLWWKDARQFFPIWLALIFAAAVTQWLVLNLVKGDSPREGLFVWLATAWAWIYGMAVGSAAFAGERETGTLRFLDALPVSRATLWGGKASFALVSTAALGLLLIGMAAVSTDRVLIEVNRQLDVFTLAAWLPVQLLLAVALGLFWSAFARTALTAAILSAVGAALAAGPSIASLDRQALAEDWQWVAVGQAVLSAILLAVSAWWVTRPERGQRVFRRFPRRARVADAPAFELHEPMEGRGHSRRAVPRLIFRAVKDGLVVGLVTVALGVFLLMVQVSNPVDPVLLASFGVLGSVTAGVSVFHADTRDRTQRFLAQHGARPGVVWVVRVAVWGVGFALFIMGVLALAAFSMRSGVMLSEQALFSLLAAPLGFSVGTLAGMTARRGVTAGLVSILATVALGVPITLLIQQQMVPPLGAFAVSLALLFVSWAWSGDWLLDRPAPGRWLRLGLWTAAAFAALFGVYAPFRAYSLPDAPPLPAPASWSGRPTPNAAPLYREAYEALSYDEGAPQLLSGAVDLDRWDSEAPGAETFIGLNAKALDLARRASAVADCRFFAPGPRTLFNGQGVGRYAELARLVGLSADARRARGDLTGAWDDIAAVFRIARHLAQGSTFADATVGLLVEQKALGLALEWAADPAQTPDRLVLGLSSFRGLPPMPRTTEFVLGEATLAEATLDLPPAELRENLFNLTTGPVSREQPWSVSAIGVITSPWERARARRAFRFLAAADHAEAAREPYQRPVLNVAVWDEGLRAVRNVSLQGEALRESIERSQTFASTFLVRLLYPNAQGVINLADATGAGRRAFEAVVGLRFWALGHGGAYPDRLDALAPGPVGSVPTDPYTGAPFQYVRMAVRTDQTLANAFRSGPLGGGSRSLSQDGLPRPAVVSAGPNRRYEGGRGDDLVFPLPRSPVAVPEVP